MVASTSRTRVRRFPGRESCGTRVHTIPDAFAISTAATRARTCSYSSSSISCGSLITATIQDTWAQISEKLGDAWGRGLRYGLGPDQPDLLVDPTNPGSVTRATVVETLAAVSETVANIEEAEYQIAKVSGTLAGQKDTAQTQMDRLLDSVSKLGGAK